MIRSSFFLDHHLLLLLCGILKNSMMIAPRPITFLNFCKKGRKEKNREGIPERGRWIDDRRGAELRGLLRCSPALRT
ncbi:hypothetical protein PVAP13_6NG350401 [Panicum virgatum]|uniref:Secreted protein n=1 Tax=Panicum virgatum TaxID=38727 RepID=A0A8T0R2H4_PANVG|nr:hypothetical protein PVAP13_6NG350401 [Panicum virgatum]